VGTWHGDLTSLWEGGGARAFAGPRFKPGGDGCPRGGHLSPNSTEWHDATQRHRGPRRGWPRAASSRRTTRCETLWEAPRGLRLGSRGTVPRKDRSTRPASRGRLPCPRAGCVSSFVPGCCNRVRGGMRAPSLRVTRRSASARRSRPGRLGVRPASSSAPSRALEAEPRSLDGGPAQIRHLLWDSALDPACGRRRAARPHKRLAARRGTATPPRPAACLLAQTRPPAPRSAEQVADLGPAPIRHLLWDSALDPACGRRRAARLGARRGTATPPRPAACLLAQTRPPAPRSAEQVADLGPARVVAKTGRSWETRRPGGAEGWRQPALAASRVWAPRWPDLGALGAHPAR